MLVCLRILLATFFRQLRQKALPFPSVSTMELEKNMTHLGSLRARFLGFSDYGGSVRIRVLQQGRYSCDDTQLLEGEVELLPQYREDCGVDSAEDMGEDVGDGHHDEAVINERDSLLRIPAHQLFAF